MVNEKLIIPKENIYKTEEVRYLDNQEDSRFTNFLKVVMPTVHCMDDKVEKQKEGAKEVIGTGLVATTAVNPVLGGIAEGVSTVVGSAAEGVGKMTGEKEVEEVGKIYKEAPVQPIKEAKEGIKKIFE